jgi:hypothetical protein
MSSEDTKTILLEAMQGRPLSIDTEEARKLRTEIDGEIEEMKKSGASVDVPFEWPD